VRIVRRDEIPYELEPRFIEVARAAFAQRRKSIKNSLASIASAAEIQRALEAASIDTSARPEELSVADFVMVTRVLA
jgi:16S rRNA A1518/A1519 N6-dimethyltransferase RsmA/KsgA/DIM1 with predicted DNA glycosylase/AP lyase activity